MWQKSNIIDRLAADDLFGPMRHATPEEHALMRKLLDSISVPFEERSIFDMDIEVDYCDICHEKKQVSRKYYHYPINCECCGGQYHFECVRYCKDCEPSPPKYIKAEVEPIEKERKINPENWEYYE